MSKQAVEPKKAAVEKTTNAGAPAGRKTPAVKTEGAKKTEPKNAGAKDRAGRGTKLRDMFPVLGKKKIPPTEAKGMSGIGRII